MSFDFDRLSHLREVFDDAEEAFAVLNIDFYLIGALAREAWYGQSKEQLRVTKDIDFAVLVQTTQQYEELRDYLTEKKGYTRYKGNAFVLISPKKTQVDILPFGEIEREGIVEIQSRGLSQISVDGFKEVHESGTEPLTTATGHKFKVATLPSILLLKLIAYDDRPEVRLKDAGDISWIIMHYFDLQAPLIYAKHGDIFKRDDIDDMSSQQICATVIGREIKAIIATNEELKQRLLRILAEHAAEKDNVFIREIVREVKINADEVKHWLQIIADEIR
jgi:predicted nucleotidyltransferase